MRTPKFNAEDVEAIQRMFAVGATLKAVGRDLKTSVITLAKIKKGTYKPNGRRNGIINPNLPLELDRPDNGLPDGTTEPQQVD